MLALRKKKLTPAEEAARQVEIANEIERQRAARQQRDRDLTARVAMRKREIWAEQVQAAEEARMEAAARPLREEAERREREREQRARESAVKIAEYRAAAEGVENIKREIANLRNQPIDLSTPEGVRAAGEREGQLVGLEAAFKKADARLLQAERAIGRHRNGGW